MSNVTPFATLITVLLTKKYSFDISTYGALLAVITYVLNYIISSTIIDKFINTISEIDTLNYRTVLLFVIIYNYKCVYNIINDYKRKGEKKIVYKTIVINTAADASTFISYVSYFPEFYSKPAQINIGIITGNKTGDATSATLQSVDRRVADNIEIGFKDTNFNTEGYYVWKKQEINLGSAKEGKDIIKCISSVYIYIDEKTCDDPIVYFKNIENRCCVKLAQDPIITTYFIKYSSLKYGDDKRCIPTNSYEIYSGKKKTINELKPIYMDTFFSHEKDIIWTVVKQIHLDPMEFFTMGQSPQAGYILHGPPGNGKSSFPYRLAMTLQIHLLCVDIRVIKKRDALYNIMRKPFIDNSMYTSPKRVIYIFDEFDITVAELYAKEKRKKKVTEEWLHVVQSYGQYSPTENKCEDNKEISTLDTMMGSSSEDLCLEDLKEFFQGTVPLEGAIIFAMTNNFDDIKKMCPALVRPGRLTPVYFGNPDRKIINEISNYYFKENLELSQNYVPSMSSSQIMKYVSESKMTEKNMNIENPHETESNRLKAYNRFVSNIDNKLNNTE